MEDFLTTAWPYGVALVVAAIVVVAAAWGRSRPECPYCKASRRGNMTGAITLPGKGGMLYTYRCPDCGQEYVGGGS